MFSLACSIAILVAAIYQVTKCSYKQNPSRFTGNLPSIKIVVFQPLQFVVTPGHSVDGW